MVGVGGDLIALRAVGVQNDGVLAEALLQLHVQRVDIIARIQPVLAAHDRGVAGIVHHHRPDGVVGVGEREDTHDGVAVRACQMVDLRVVIVLKDHVEAAVLQNDAAAEREALQHVVPVCHLAGPRLRDDIQRRVRDGRDEPVEILVALVQLLLRQEIVKNTQGVRTGMRMGRKNVDAVARHVTARADAILDRIAVCLQQTQQVEADKQQLLTLRLHIQNVGTQIVVDAARGGVGTTVARQRYADGRGDDN